MNYHIKKCIEGVSNKNDLNIKIKKERESIRALCDDLREQRDKAIRDLTDYIRECDDLKRQKNLAIQQIRKLEYLY